MRASLVVRRRRLSGEAMTISGIALRAAFAIGCAAWAAAALGDDPTARALLQRQQQSDTFSLQLQQSIQNFRAGELSPQQRLDFDALQRNQRLGQDELNYRQEIQQRQTQQTTPNDALRRAETMRFEQERQMQQDRSTRDAGSELNQPTPAIPNPQPAL